MLIKSVVHTDQEKMNDLLSPVPKELWSSSSSDIEKIKLVTPIRGTVDNSKPLPNI